MADLRRVFQGESAKSKPVVVVTAIIAALAYWSTLLPGQDLGDTASFQTIVTFPLIVPRHAYPLYFALGKLVVWVTGAEPAWALNLLSAIAGSAAVGAFAWFALQFTASRMAAAWSALMLAFSYTFWSHAIIAEVYTLEAFFVALVFALAVRWWHRPTTGRLAWLYAMYALSFGNHLTMVLFAPALVVILWSARHRARLSPFSPRGIALAAAIAAAGALQYAWNLYGLMALSGSRGSIAETLATFWFDVTKTDWRESLVGTVPVRQWGDRVAMFWWDLGQQFGLAGILVSMVGIWALARASRTWLLALGLAWITTFTFAFFYNVGDAHAFLLPSHVIFIMFAAAGASALVTATRTLRAPAPAAVAVLLFLVPIWRGFDTRPAVDRRSDTRPSALAAEAIRGLEPSTSVYVGDLNWQLQNAVSYEIARRRPELPRVFTSSVLWHLPEFVRRNHALGRDVVLTPPAAATIRAVYGERFDMTRDPRARVSTLDDVPLPARGTPYVLAVLTPLPGFAFDRDRVIGIARALAGEDLPHERYVVFAGQVGLPPAVKVAAARPFDISERLPFGRLRVRIDAWLPADTMRRAGFGHIIVNGGHALTLERGATLGTFDLQGRLVAHAYEGGSFSLEGRYLIPVLK